MKVLYFFDAYCGWCYGFGSILAPFLANHPELKVEILSGGLFVGEKVQPIKTYQHIPEGNARIKEYYGVTFGQGYQALLEAGNLVLNSSHPAIALRLLLPYVADHLRAHFVHEVQEAFFIEGRSLSEIQTYRPLIAKYQIDPTIIERMEAYWQDETFAAKSFIEVYTMGIATYPTVVIKKGDQYYDLRGQATRVQELERNYQAILAIE